MLCTLPMLDYRFLCKALPAQIVVLAALALEASALDGTGTASITLHVPVPPILEEKGHMAGGLGDQPIEFRPMLCERGFEKGYLAVK